MYGPITLTEAGEKSCDVKLLVEIHFRANVKGGRVAAPTCTKLTLPRQFFVRKTPTPNFMKT
jgi:hypothetical protein